MLTLTLTKLASHPNWVFLYRYWYPTASERKQLTTLMKRVAITTWDMKRAHYTILVTTSRMTIVLMKQCNKQTQPYHQIPGICQEKIASHVH
jgi:hypothetical protein